MTPLELGYVSQGYKEREERRIDDLISIGYYASYWVNAWQDRRHRPQPLDKILGRKKTKQKKAMTSEEMYKQVLALHKAFGGE